MVNFPIALGAVAFPIYSTYKTFPLVVSVVASSFDRLCSTRCFSDLVVFSSGTRVSSSSPEALVALPQTAVHDFKCGTLVGYVLTLFAPWGVAKSVSSEAVDFSVVRLCWEGVSTGLIGEFKCFEYSNEVGLRHVIADTSHAREFNE